MSTRGLLLAAALACAGNVEATFIIQDFNDGIHGETPSYADFTSTGFVYDTIAGGSPVPYSLFDSYPDSGGLAFAPGVTVGTFEFASPVDWFSVGGWTLGGSALLTLRAYDANGVLIGGRSIAHVEPLFDGYAETGAALSTGQNIGGLFSRVEIECTSPMVVDLIMYEIAPVPDAGSTLGLLALGLVGLVHLRRSHTANS